MLKVEKKEFSNIPTLGYPRSNQSAAPNVRRFHHLDSSFLQQLWVSAAGTLCRSERWGDPASTKHAWAHNQSQSELTDRHLGLICIHQQTSKADFGD